MLEIVIEIEGTQVKATAFGSRMERPAPQMIGEVSDIEVFGKKVGRSVKTGKPLEPAVVEEAQRLYDRLFGGEIRDVLTRVRAEASEEHVVVRLLVRNRALQAIPWEALCQPGTSEGFLAAGTRVDVVRGVSSSEPTIPQIVQGAIRVLSIAPTGDTGLVNLKGAVESAISKGRLSWLDPMTGADVSPRRLFQRLRGDVSAHVIHFIGHGGIDGDGHPALRLSDDEYGDEVWLKVETLAGELAAGFGKELRLVVLEACEGASPGALGSAAEILARAGAQAVVAYLWPVRAETARTCSEEFYRALLQSERGRGDVAKSLSAARRTLLLESAAGFSPVVYLRGAEARLFDFGAVTAKSVSPTLAPAVEAGPFIVPFKKNPLFVGRDAEAEKLHELLQVDQNSGANMVALSGMGGIGKTLIAAEYAHRYRDAYPDGVYWINAAHDWQGELGRLGKMLGCRPAEGTAEAEHIRYARAFAESVRNNPNALLIFDNIDNPLELQDVSLDVVPARFDCKMVYTTRRRELPAAEIFVGVLAEAAAVDLLLAKSRRKAHFEQLPPQQRAAAHSICQILGGHPLAIALAGAYLDKNPRITFGSYLDGLQTEGALAVIEATRIDARLLATQHEGNVGATLNVQWKSLESESARLVLQTAALLSESPIPRARLSLLTGLSDEPHSWREAPLEDALRELSSLSLLEEVGPQTVKLHRLIRELIEKQMVDRTAFAAVRASILLEALWDVKKLESEVSKRGIPEVLGDLNVARGFANAADLERLNILIRPLDREAHHLQNGPGENRSAYFMQQLHNQLFELGSGAQDVEADPKPQMMKEGLDGLLKRLRTALDTAKCFWFRQYQQTNGDSRALVRSFDAHRAGVHGLALSADGRIALSSGADGTVKMWDWAKGRLLRTFVGHARAVNGVAITPDAQYVVSGSDDRTIRVWDANTGRLLKSLTGHTEGIFRLVVTADGKMAISASKDGTIRLWDLVQGRAERIVEKAQDQAIDFVYKVFAATDVALTNDGKYAIVASQEGSVVIWDVTTWRVVRTLTGHRGPVWTIAINRAGRLIFSGSDDGSVKCWNFATGQCLQTMGTPDNDVLAVALTDDERHIVAGYRDGVVKVWDASTTNLVHTFRGHSHSVFDIVTTPDAQIISGSVDGTMRIWTLDAVHDDEKNEGHHGGVCGLIFLPDGRALATASLDNTIQLRDADSGRVLRTFRGHERGVFDVVATLDGRYLVSASDDKTLRVWNVETGHVERTFEGHSDLVRGVALTPDGRRILSASYDGTIRVWDFSTGLIVNVLEGHTLGVRDVVVTPDGSRAISASFDKTLKIWDIEQAIALHTLEGHVDGVWTLAVTPDGRYVVSGGKDASVRVWEMATGQLVRTLTGHTDMVLGIAVSGDGKTVISVSGDMSVKAWDFSTGEQIATLGSFWPLMSCALAGDDKKLAIGTSTGAVLGLVLEGRNGVLNRPKEKPLEHLLSEDDIVGQAALDILQRAPRARELFESGGPEECEAGLLVVRMLGRASPAIEMAAAHFEVHTDASFVDYVDELGLEAMLGSTVSPADDSYWTSDRIEAVRKAAFDVSWRAMSDTDARNILCTAAVFDGGVPPTAALLGLLTGLVGNDEQPYARTQATVQEVARRGWLETQLGLNEIHLRHHVRAYVAALVGAWESFVKARFVTLHEAIGDIEKIEREVKRRGVAAAAGDLRVGVILATFAGEPDVLMNRWRIFARETQSFTDWDSNGIPNLFLQQMRNRALEMGDEATKAECEAALERRKTLWLRERFRINRESAALVRTYRGHAAEARAALFRMNKGRIQFISGSDDRTLRLWDSVTGLPVSIFEGHSGPITDVALSPDGRYAVSSSEDGTLRKWDLWTGVLSHIFEGRSPVRRVAVDATGKYMLSSGADDVVRVWDFASGDIVQTLGMDGDRMTWVALSQTGTTAVAATPDGPLSVQRFEDGGWKQIHALQGHSGRVNDVIISSDCKHALSASDDGTIKWWDIENGSLVASLDGHTAAVTRIRLRPDACQAMSVSRDKTARLWDLVEKKELNVLHGHTDAIWGLDVDWTGEIAVTASSDRTVRLWAPQEKTPVQPMVGHTASVFGVVVTRDGRRAVSSGTDKKICIWDLTTGALERSIDGLVDVAMGLAVSPDGKTIVAGCDDGKVRIWDLADGRLLRQVDHEARRVRGMALTSDGKTAFSACHDNLVRVWDTTTGELIRRLEGHSERVRVVAAMPDDKHLISGGFDNSLRVWDWTTGKTVRVLQGHASAIWSLAVSPDGRHAISGAFDRGIRIWELSTGRLVRTLEGHTDWVMGLAVTNDGRRIISASQDMTLAIWDLHTGTRTALLATNAAIHCIALTPDGNGIVVGDASGAVRIIDIVEG